MTNPQYNTALRNFHFLDLNNTFKINNIAHRSSQPSEVKTLLFHFGNSCETKLIRNAGCSCLPNTTIDYSFSINQQ